MKLTSDRFAAANQRLSESCRACSVQCCKKRLLLLLPEELAAIEEWLGEYAPDKLKSFRDRTRHYDDFALFDQQQSCLFLDESDLCVRRSSQLHPWSAEL